MYEIVWKTLRIAAISLPLSQGFSTLNDIDAFRCCFAEISDNLACDKRLIVLIISVLQQTVAARSYEKTYNLAGAPAVQYQRNVLSISILHLIREINHPARWSEISL